MDSRHIQPVRRAVSRLVVVVLACASLACASATLLLEEPYGKLGFFTATGHAAIYLSGVCAETPLLLRPCAPGETGVVLSRYDGVGGYDWVAIPLIPYLYAVERPEDVPLFADARMAAFLRDRYRRKYLEDIAPDAKDGETPGGNWYELVGSSYDRTIYGFEIETTPKQDEALIRKLQLIAEPVSFPPRLQQLRGLRQRRSELLLPEVSASQHHRRCRNDNAETDGENAHQVQRAPS